MGQAAYDLFMRRMADRLQELSAFVRTAETGSFSRVAQELGLSQPSVSRLVASLEARLGVTLLLRTTRRVTPTEAGSALLVLRTLLSLGETRFVQMFSGRIIFP